MSAPYNPDPPDPDRLLELCRRRVDQWEKATSHRQESEAAEAFTRAFAELDVALANGAQLPRDWRAAQPYTEPEPEGSIYPVRELLGAHRVRMEKGTDGPGGGPSS